jgi:DNA-binding winged helix-turn-helix (wHTH) protein
MPGKRFDSLTHYFGKSAPVLMLVERPRKIVSREEIKSRLWPNDTVVDFDQSINATI